jgi:beta-aspartyl-dipeptidase (metallo-type)|tara:strand:+ start:758 stop:1897 length:1140 start_codon:yes stop_codon:yes gene_type:complete
MLLVKNTNLYSPEKLGLKDILISNGKIVAIEDKIEENSLFNDYWDAQGAITTAGFIDQHIHVIGAGGKHGFSSMTPEIQISELVKCGTTTVVGLLGTDGSTKSVKTLFSKIQALNQEGISAYMYTGYYGLDKVYLMSSLQEDMIYIDKVIGCKIALSDIRSSYPTALELLRLLRNVRVGGMLASKKGILHIHLGALSSKMDILFEIIENYEFPISHISPTHVGRTKELFEQAIQFAKMGGMIDITTGASKYTDPYKSVLYALEKGVLIDNMTFSSDGNAGLDRLDDNGNLIGFKRAPFDKNLEEVINLVTIGGIPLEKAIKLITTNPAKNLGLKNKGHAKVGYDADLCFFDSSFKLQTVISKGNFVLKDSDLIVKGSFE